MERYRPIVIFSCEHAYATEQQAPRFVCIPGDDTLHVLNQANALFRPSPTGFEVLVAESGMKVLQLYASSEFTRLVFKCFCPDPNFANYTASKIIPGSNCFYVTDDNIDQEGQLHQSEYLGESEIFSLALPPELGDNEPAAQTDPQGLSYLPLHCQVELNNSDRVRSPVVVIDLSLENLLQATHPARLSVAFNASRYVWKYMIFGGENYQELTIIDLQGEIQFEYKGKETIGLRESDVFMSSTPIPFQKQFIRQFQLKDIGARFDNIIVDRLPVASVSSAPVYGPDSTGPRATEIFVNL